MTVKKIFAILMVLTMVCGVAAATALATPDEWIPGQGPYLDFAGEVDETDEQSQADESEKSVYTVRKGDNLNTIARNFGVSLNELVSFNDLQDADLIREGQVIFVPGISGYYSVVSGDTLSCIAQRFGVSIRDISAANGLRDNDLLVVGQNLVIPGGRSSRGAFATGSFFRSLPVGEMEWPVVGWISSPFGFRDGKPHEGIDIAANHGMPIKATMSGRVAFAGPRGTYGMTVILDHGEGLSSLYAHSSKLLVSEGEWVNKGQVIALVGNTGRSRGPHLHLEVLINGLPYDPLICLNRGNA